MPNYKNNSFSVKTFYDVEFKPGEVHSVEGLVDVPYMDKVSDEFFQNVQETPAPKSTRKTRTTKSKTVQPVVEDSPEETILSESDKEGEEK